MIDPSKVDLRQQAEPVACALEMPRSLLGNRPDGGTRSSPSLLYQYDQISFPNLDSRPGLKLSSSRNARSKYLVIATTVRKIPEGLSLQKLKCE